jgi:microcystin degradation protein MlrC
MAENADLLVTYRENPHTDGRDSAIRAAKLLDRLLHSGERPQTVLVQPPLIWPPTGTGTADEPMLSLEKRAREIEAATPEILCVNVHAGFAFADIPHTGVSFSVVTTGGEKQARELAHELSDMATRNRQAGNVIDPPPHQVLPQVQQMLEERKATGETSGPILLVEASTTSVAALPATARICWMPCCAAVCPVLVPS